jgi:predicted membrane GTPase involved in stress response
MLKAGKAQNLYLNPCLKKRLTNIRAPGADDKIVLGSPSIMTLEEALSYMGEDEIVEITPKTIRLRKVRLDPPRRMRGGKGKGA